MPAAGNTVGVYSGIYTESLTFRERTGDPRGAADDTPVVVTTNTPPVFSRSAWRDVGHVNLDLDLHRWTRPCGAIEIPSGASHSPPLSIHSNEGARAGWQLARRRPVLRRRIQQVARECTFTNNSALAPLQENGVAWESDLLLGQSESRAQVPLVRTSPGLEVDRRRDRLEQGLGHRCLHLRAEFWHGRSAIHSRSGICRSRLPAYDGAAYGASASTGRGAGPRVRDLTL